MAHDHSEHTHCDDHASEAHSHHSGDCHDHAAHASRNRVAWAGVLTALFMIAEVIGGIVSGSLALLADAAHMLTDSASLLLAWFGFWLAERPSDSKRSYGFGRFRILAAFANGLTLILLAGWILIEAAQRLMSPTPVESTILMGVAIAGLVINIIAFFILHGGDDHAHGDVNLEGALWHVAGDMLGSVVAIIAAITIMFTGWMPIDPILSAIVAIIIGFGGYRVIKRSGHILLEGEPEGFDKKHLINDLISNINGLEAIHHVHAWTLTGSDVMITMNVCLGDNIDSSATLALIKQRLLEQHKLGHATIEVSPPDMDIHCPADVQPSHSHSH